jgi:transcription elongation factor GreB
MSKAFTRESDDLPDEPILPRQSSLLPTGFKNYITAAGAQQLREKLDHLIQNERPQVAASAQGDNAKRQLYALDQRIEELQQSLQAAEIVPPNEETNEVRFGATVTVRERSSGKELTYRIVGVDETDFDRGWVSWLSPIAKALLTARLGDRVRFKFPDGEEELEIVSIRYE